MLLFVLYDGFVVHGKVVWDNEDAKVPNFIIANCGIVRRWGTTAGLGQLASYGPQKETIIDSTCDGHCIYKHDVKFTIPCEESAWSKWMKSKK